MATCAVCELHAESTFKIEGMDCREEVAMIERRFKNLPGLEDFSADLVGQRLHVKYDATKVSASAIVAAVADAGMRAWLEHEEPIAAGGRAARARRVLLAISGAALGARTSWSILPAAASPLGLVLFGLSIALGVPPTASAGVARAFACGRSTSTCSCSSPSRGPCCSASGPRRRRSCSSLASPARSRRALWRKRGRPYAR